MVKGNNWSETYYRESNLSDMYRLYTKFINKQKPGTPIQDVLTI